MVISDAFLFFWRILPIDKEMDKQMIITIDGPAGSGKSTIARILADKLNISYLDTGAMYRGITLAAMESGVDFTSAEQIERCARETELSFDREDGVDHLVLNNSRKLADGRVVSEVIREVAVTNNSRAVADNPAVRAILVTQQQSIGEQVGSLVTEGRDQGTVVFPGAEYKIYLDAKAETRARRRFEQMRAKGDATVTYEQILSDQLKRDEADKARGTGGLKAAEDAVIVDTTEMDIDQVVEHLYKMVSKI